MVFPGGEDGVLNLCCCYCCNDGRYQVPGYIMKEMILL